MPEPFAVTAAASVLRDLLGRDLLGQTTATAAPTVEQLLDAIRRFAEVRFAVAPHLPDQDGLLFQYATIDAGVFTLGFVRQFDVVDEDDEHLQYVQTRAEYRFTGQDAVPSGEHLADWWFRGGPETFDSWFARVTADPVWQRVDVAAATAFVVDQDVV